MELSMEHAAWLEEERAIPCEIAAEVGLRSVNGNLVFPYGSFQKFRSRDKRYWVEPKGAELCLWNEHQLAEPHSQDDVLIITEGEFDALSFIAAGYRFAVSVPNGSPTEEVRKLPKYIEEDTAYRYLWNGNKLKPALQSFRKVILATDDDSKGHALRDELAIRIGRPRCWVVEYPTGCKDANDVLKKYGQEILSHMVIQARPMVADRLTKLASIPSSGALKSYSTGWSDLDQNIMFVPPELMIVTGAPTSGKSQWTLALVANLARVHGMKGAILQFEDRSDRNVRDLKRYARSWHGQEKNSINQDPDQWVMEMFQGISPNEQEDGEVDFDLKWLQQAIEEAACRHDCKWVLIDPWNEVEHCFKVNESETQYTNSALRELKRLARRFQILIIVVAHPAKFGAMTKKIDELTLYDVSGSAAWKNKADHGVIIYRSSPSDMETFVKIDKCKDFETMGRPGTVVMRFDPPHATFSFVKRCLS